MDRVDLFLEWLFERVIYPVLPYAIAMTLGAWFGLFYLLSTMGN